MWSKQMKLGVQWAGNPMACDKENEQNQTKIYPVFLIWKTFGKHNPQRKVIADKDLCL